MHNIMCPKINCLLCPIQLLSKHGNLSSFESDYSSIWGQYRHWLAALQSSQQDLSQLYCSWKCQGLSLGHSAFKPCALPLSCTSFCSSRAATENSIHTVGMQLPEHLNPLLTWADHMGRNHSRASSPREVQLLHNECPHYVCKSMSAIPCGMRFKCFHSRRDHTTK